MTKSVKIYTWPYVQFKRSVPEVCEPADYTTVGYIMDAAGSKEQVCRLQGY